jgi:hypothetical protein
MPATAAVARTVSAFPRTTNPKAESIERKVEIYMMKKSLLIALSVEVGDGGVHHFGASPE